MHEEPAIRGAGWRALGGWLALVALVAASWAIVGPLDLFAASPGPSAASATAAASAGPTSDQTVLAGRGLYQAQCASCHGQQGQGTANGPSLAGAGAAAADFYLRTGRMPLSAPGEPVTRHPTRLTNEQIGALTQVVASFGPGPDIPQVQGGGDVSDGSRLYVANCAACHGATGSGDAIGGGATAPNLGQATPLDVVEAMRIGPGTMPQFAFTAQDEAAIAAYVADLQDRPSPGGVPVGGLGAVGEGFVAVAIGLTLVVLAAMFVGRRSHEGEPPSGPLP